MPDKRKGMLVYALLLTAAFSFRVAVARLLPNDTPDDGKIYAQIARNVLEQHVYSHATEPPYEPSLIRLPGYPLFVAGIYSIFGHGDNTAVRITQALIDTATCAMIALVAFFWEPQEKLKRRTSIAALALAAVCPFSTIYVATILTEIPTIFLAIAMCLTATLAFRAARQSHAMLLWSATGILAGVAVLFRPDSGLFAAAIGITLVVTVLARSSGLALGKRRDELLYRFSRATYLGALFSLAFCLVLVPWAIRNYRMFHVFQPLAPAHAEMPGEFVPRGYLSWLRTWIDDERHIGPVLWALGESPITLNDIPYQAFDSAEEKKRVGALLEKYNHPPEEANTSGFEPQTPSAEEQDNQTQDNSNSNSADEGDNGDEANQGDEGDGSDQSDEGDTSQPTDQTAEKQPVEMTPEIDADFAKIAAERVARHPFRYYVWLPLKRARTLWFDTHSQYYPFEGELLPLEDLDHDTNQHIWLPLFAGLTFIYTVLGIAGAWFLWESREFVARQWVLLVALIVFLRVGFFATLENPEPRYVVEIFPFLSILGGIALIRILARIGAKLSDYSLQKSRI
ncbi:MAG: glycosyltransferase family 39 protein [Acidobacteriota bacterium]|nr:glycosyltransferase family 39 protein [Acidobacteriota bacterium]